MRILFINVLNEFRKRKVETRQPSLGTLYLASYLSKYGGFNDIQVLETGYIDKETLIKINPDVVGVSSITQHFGIAKKLCSNIKQLMDIPVVVGGYHVSALPNNLTEVMDVAVLGEGEETMLELACILEHSGLVEKNLSKVKGIAFRNSAGKLVITPKRKLIEPLDKIPFPNRRLVHFGKNQAHSLITSRGCPYHCVFCSSSAFWKKTRYFSPSYVVAELRQVIQEYSPEVIGFADDLFATNKKRLRNIVKLIKNEQFYGKVKFTCSARANLVDAETIKLLKEAGVIQVMMGLESGSNRILKYLKAGSVTVNQNWKAINLLKANDLKPTATFIIGSPDETKAEMEKTLDFVKRSGLASFETYVLLPLPNTQVWNEARVKGIVGNFMDWDQFEIYFEENPKNRVTVSSLSRNEQLSVLQQFKKEERKVLVKRAITQGMRHPLKAYKFAMKALRR